MHTISQVIPAYGLIGLAYVGCNQTMSVFWLCVCIGFNGAVYSGFFGNHMELSPNYAGTLMGFTNMAANITGKQELKCKYPRDSALLQPNYAV